MFNNVRNWFQSPLPYRETVMRVNTHESPFQSPCTIKFLQNDIGLTGHAIWVSTGVHRIYLPLNRGYLKKQYALITPYQNDLIDSRNAWRAEVKEDAGPGTDSCYIEFRNSGMDSADAPGTQDADTECILVLRLYPAFNE